MYTTSKNKLFIRFIHITCLHDLPIYSILYTIAGGQTMGITEEQTGNELRQIEQVAQVLL